MCFFSVYTAIIKLVVFRYHENVVMIQIMLVRNDMDVNEHERLSNFTLREKFK